MNKTITIGRHKVGIDHPVYFIADIAANHDGSLEKAKELIHLSFEAGANAVKFQNFKAETIVSDYGFRSMSSQLAHQSTWTKSVVEVYRAASLPMEWTGDLKATCDEVGIDYFTAPYYLGLLEELSRYVCAWKVGSGDITWHENIARMAADGKPILIATGASDLEEVREAMAIAQKYTDDIVLMQCNTNYTASLENFHHIALNVLKTFCQEFPNIVLGLSDHTPGHATVLGSIALGARAIEKHFTSNTSLEGPDHKFSMDPASWREMVDRCRELEAALGPEEKRIMDNEKESVVVQRRAIRTTRAVKVGERFEPSYLTVLRPCPSDALPPFELERVIGKVANRNIVAGDYILNSDLV